MEELALKTVANLALLAAITAVTSGCIYINGEKINVDDWRESQLIQREAISQLQLGQSLDAVKAELGVPSDSEAFLDGDTEVRVLFYRTRRTHADGETTRDEMTPLVFRDNVLVGWGERYYSSFR
mgnify:FL=1